MKYTLTRWVAIVAMLSFTFSLTSCDDDEEDIDPIIGTWTVSDFSFSVSIGGIVFTQDQLEALGADFDDDDFGGLATGTIEFKTDQTVTISSPDSPDAIGTWAYNSDRTEVIITSSDPSDDPIKFKIESITASNATFKLEFSEIEDGVETIISVDLILTK